MRIYIPSKARADSPMRTWNGLSEAVRKHRTQIVVGPDDVESYEAAGYGDALLVHPEGMTIGEVRQWIVDYHLDHHDDPRLVMMDDDLDFYKRRKDHPGRFVGADPESVTQMLITIYEALERYPHVGVCPREQGHRWPPYETFFARMTRVLAYDAAVLRKVGATFTRVKVMEDFDVALQLLRRGYATNMITAWLQGQAKSNAPGGCSTYRTPEMQEAAAKKLAELHPGLVTVAQRRTKGGWFEEKGEGSVRYDVRIQWAGAYEDGLKWRTKVLDERGKQ